jgi:hypothetical protein
MSLLKFFLNYPAIDDEINPARPRRDDELLDHPDIASMSQRELADLPLPIPTAKQMPQRQLEKCE